MDKQVLELIISKLETKSVELKDFIGDGGCKTYDHYKELCGVIRGLRSAQVEIEDLARKMELNDE